MLTTPSTTPPPSWRKRTQAALLSVTHTRLPGVCFIALALATLILLLLIAIYTLPRIDLDEMASPVSPQAAIVVAPAASPAADFAPESSAKSRRPVLGNKPAAALTSWTFLANKGGLNASSFIYVYDLPSEYNADLVAKNPSCQRNMFSAEVIMHRYLLQSRARTLDPARAGLFFTPAYSSCKLTLKEPRVEGKAPTNPHIKQQVFIRDVLAYLRKQPAAMARWWRRYAGLDHVFMFTHDFGGCLDYRDHGHGIPSLIREHARHVIFAQPNGEFTSSCFNPHKDLVIPPVSTLVLSQLELGQQLPLGHSSMRSSPHLIYFRGTVEWDWLGQPDPKYSRGVRQAIFSLYGSPESRANFPQFRLHSGSAPQAQYLNELQSATFCLCPLGYATWSPRLVDAIVTGCIPVIIADDTRPPFTDILDYSRFSIAITEKEAVFPGRLQELLSRISADQVQQMQAELARPSVWRPFVFAPKPADCGACEALVDSLWRHRTRLGV